MVEYGADVNLPGYQGQYPLHSCAGGEKQSTDLCQLLINNGAVVNVYEALAYQTPVMWAARQGYDGILKMLITYGADIQIRDAYGQLAIHHGACSDSEDVFITLRDVDSDFEAVDNEGNVPLHLAAEHNAVNFARLLLGSGVEASPQNKRADQPSHIAARGNFVPLLKVICMYDTHIGRLNYDHQTPLGCARTALAEEAVTFLTQHFKRYHIGDTAYQGASFTHPHNLSSQYTPYPSFQYVTHPLLNPISQSNLSIHPFRTQCCGGYMVGKRFRRCSG